MRRFILLSAFCFFALLAPAQAVSICTVDGKGTVTNDNPQCPTAPYDYGSKDIYIGAGGEEGARLNAGC